MHHFSVGDVTVFIMEQLAGLDVLTYLASKREYSEQHVVTIAMQVRQADSTDFRVWRNNSLFQHSISFFHQSDFRSC